MIVVKLQGGLGNQLFQYAIGKRLSLFYNTPLKLDTSFFNMQVLIKTEGVTPRKYELDQLNIQADIAIPDDIQLFSNSNNLMHRVKKYFTQSKYITEKNFRFDPGFLSFGENCYLDGFWQCESYFKEVVNVLKNDFSCRFTLDKINVDMEAKIRAANGVSIHIRRGDYIHNAASKRFHGTCSMKYYQEAIELISKKLTDPHFFIFSDDMQWVANNFKIDFASTLIDINNDSSCVNDFQLMSACRHHIIANSSFSWWGAWLGNFNNKIVIAPKVWFADLSVDTSTILPETWYKL